MMRYRFVAEFASKSSPGTWHQVKENERGELSCGCKGWINKKRGKPRTCIHVQTVGFQRISGAANPWIDELDAAIVKPKPKKRGVPKTAEVVALPTFTLPRPPGARLIEFSD